MRKLFLTAFLILSAYMLMAQTRIQVQTHKVVAVDEKFNVTFVVDGKVDDSDFIWCGALSAVIHHPYRL